MRFLPLCVIIVSFISLSGSLELEIFPSPLEVSVNEDALLKCKYSNPEPDLTHVAVRWVFESQTSWTDVYIFNGGEHLPKRNGAKIFDDALRKGNASLYLPNVQLNEEGNYTCIVFVTPHKEEKSSVMQVSVQPKVSMSAQEVTTANGTETILACDVKEFYPKQINISWLKVSNGKMEYISKDQSTEVLVTNSDGTFSVSSKLRIEPTLEDRTKYRCVVRHKTILGNFTLDTDPVEEQIPIGPIVGGFAALLCAVCLGVCIWKKKCKGQRKPKESRDDIERTLLQKTFPQSERVLPKISDFRKPHEIINGEQTNLGWEVTVFNPEVVNIVISLKRKDEQKVKKLFHWKVPARGLRGPKRVCVPLTNVPDLCKKDDSFSAEVPDLQRTSEGHFCIPCTITLCPDICKDDDAELIIEVSQESAEEAQTNSTVLKVTAGQTIPKKIEDDNDRSLLENVPDSERVLPKISDFKKPHEIINGEQTNLGWEVTVFNPEVVNIVISLKRKDEQKVKKLFHWKVPARKLRGPKRVCAPLTNVPDLCKKDNSFSAEVPELQRTSEGHFCIPCTITLCPDICKDDDAELIIEVSQESAEEAQTNSTVLKVTAGQTIPKKIEDDNDRSLLENVPDSERVLPKISDFKKPHEIINGEQTNLGWEVTVFNPEVVNIVISLKRKDEQKVKKLFHWKVPARRLRGPKRVCAPLTNVPDLCKKDDSFSAEVPELQRTSEGHFCIPCTITLCPDICKDDDAELIIEVSQESAEEAQTNSTVLKVTAGQTIPKKIEDDNDRSLLENVPDSERVLPKISDFKKPHEIINGEQTNLGWEVTVFNPEVVNIVISLKRKDEQKVKKLFHWKVPARGLRGPKSVCVPLTNVPDLCKKDDSFSAEVPELQRTSEGHFCIPCTITLCPDICKDDDAELIIEVSQESAEEAQTNSTVLKVTAGQTIPKKIEDDNDRSLLENVPDSERVSPVISDIKKLFEITHGEQTSLSWEVTVFNPELVNIVTSLKRKGEQEAKKLFHWEMPAKKLRGPKAVCAPLTNVSDLCKKDDSFSAEVPELQRMPEGSFQIPCTLTLCPDISKDNGAELIIEVSQESAEEAQTKSTVLKVTAGQPGPKEIEDNSGRSLLEKFPHSERGQPISMKIEDNGDRSLLENVPDSERVPPHISDIKKPQEIINGEQTNLGWEVTVFNPEAVNIVISLKRKSEQEAKRLFHWEMPMEELSEPKAVCAPLTYVSELCKKDDSFSAEVPELQRMPEGSFHIPCTITLCPDISKDNGAELIIEVSQESAEEAQTKSTVLKVTAGQPGPKEIEDNSGRSLLEKFPNSERGQPISMKIEDNGDRSLLENVPDSERVPPHISDIKKPQEIINGEQTNLGWEVTVFNPEAVNIVISLKRKSEQEAKRLFHWEMPMEELSEPKAVCAPLTYVSELCKKDDSFSAEVPELQHMPEGSFHIPCTITLCPDISKDNGAELIIEVSQESAEEAQTKSTVLKVTAGQPGPKEIEDNSGRSLLEKFPNSERENPSQ